MLNVQIDIDGSLSGEIGKIIAWGVAVSGDNVYQGAPSDYEPEKYTYTPNEDGSFNPDGFERIPQDEPILE